ncbi:hypothetical protein PMIN01_05963 [Paraphaeosphaeria minitans]|uniref:Uncharacterized protein n=1 Tax=Paraphaeosphaeria minitans TaxID=565426 RepID=A0A9P6GJ55_9PLEO|nr:hypothetical protein PMIN01_05963 [Paraphaeosphaeria minitans]
MLATSYSAVGFALVGLYRGEEAAKVIEKAFAVSKDKTDVEKLAGYNVDRYYRNLGRAKFYMGLFDEPKRDVEESQRWQARVYGEGSHYHGEAQYDLGEIAMKQGNLQSANTHSKRPMISCSQESQPISRSWRADEKALTCFERCLTICQINEPKRGDQGESARVMWRISQVLNRQRKIKEAAAFHDAAEKTKSTLEKPGEFPHVDDYENSWDCFLGQLYR